MKPEWIIDRVIDLAKELHELGYWREIQYGDWYINPGENRVCLWVKDYPYTTGTHCPNIPTLTDCLDWLEEKRCPEIAVYARPLGLMKTSHGVEVFQEANWGCTYGDDVKNSYTTAPTPTEAAYLAMIKILEVDNE